MFLFIYQSIYESHTTTSQVLNMVLCIPLCLHCRSAAVQFCTCYVYRSLLFFQRLDIQSSHCYSNTGLETRLQHITFIDSHDAKLPMNSQFIAVSWILARMLPSTHIYSTSDFTRCLLLFPPLSQMSEVFIERSQKTVLTPSLEINPEGSTQNPMGTTVGRGHCLSQ